MKQRLERRYIGLIEAGYDLGVTDEAIRRKAKAGKIPGFIFICNRWKIKKEDWDSYLDGLRNGGIRT